MKMSLDPDQIKLLKMRSNKLITSDLDEKFNERHSEYKNMRKVKISARFCLKLLDEYQATEESKKISASYKDYFNDI